MKREQNSKSEMKESQPKHVNRENVSVKDTTSKSHPIERLHRSLGNQAVQELYRRGELKAKLKVNRSGDRFEREADQVANEITQSSKTDRLIQSVQVGGKPLSNSTRSYFEPRFGHGFSNVRIHTGGKADEVARSINAEAFTIGSNIGFADGNYQPNSKEGKQLLAHELTHVVQQRLGTPDVQRQESETAAPTAAGKMWDAMVVSPLQEASEKLRADPTKANIDNAIGVMYEVTDQIDWLRETAYTGPAHDNIRRLLGSFNTSIFHVIRRYQTVLDFMNNYDQFVMALEDHSDYAANVIRDKLP